MCVFLVCVVLFVAQHVTCQMNFRSVNQTAVVVATDWKLMRDILTLWFLYCLITCERGEGIVREMKKTAAVERRRETNEGVMQREEKYG